MSMQKRRNGVIATADAHWWVFADPKEILKKMSTRGGRTCKVGIVFQDEVYVHLTPPTARRLLAGFGIVFGADHVVIYIEPKKTLDIGQTRPEAVSS